MTPIPRRKVLAGTLATVAGAAALDGLKVPPAAAAEAAAPEFGPVTVLPDDARYADLTVGNNARWSAKPDSVRLVGSTAQAVGVVQEALSRHKRLTVRSGGHCYADFVFNPEVDIVLDMSEMKAVSYDPARKAFMVEAGATLLDVYETLFRGWGVAIPGGMCYSVGMGGHVSGGGYGMLSRAHGLTVDHLEAVEVVVAGRDRKARAIVASRDPSDPHHDLWWAHTGGGGGNFGVITKYWFRSPSASGDAPGDQLMRPPAKMLVSAIGLPWSKLDQAAFSTLVRNYTRWHEQNSGADSRYAALCSFLMMNHRSNDAIGMLTGVDATVPDADGMLRSYLNAVLDGTGLGPVALTTSAGEHGPLPDLFTPRALPWLTTVKLLGTSNPTLTDPALRGSHKSAYFKKRMSDQQVEVIYRQLTRSDYQNPKAMVVLLSFGGKINNIAPSATASAQRDSVFKGLFQGFWTDPNEDSAHTGWVRDVYSQVFVGTGGYPAPNEQTDGCYINYPDVDITDPQQNRSGVPWHTLYYKSNYPKLQQIKATYDPGGFFRHSQSVTPAG